jgi:hypothetical protein
VIFQHLWPQTQHPSPAQYRLYSIWFVKSVKGEEEGDRGNSISIPVGLVFILHSLLTFYVGQDFVQFLHNRWNPLSDGDVEERNTVVVMWSVLAEENGMSVGLGGHNRASESKYIETGSQGSQETGDQHGPPQ